MSEKKLPALEIRTVPISELKDHPKNPRQISSEALKGLQASIDMFGMIEPIIWNQRTGFIVGGHQRKKALEAAGYTETPVLVVDFDPEKEMMANVTLNNPHIQGTYTPEVVEHLDWMAERDGAASEALGLDTLRADFPEENPTPKEKPEVEFTGEIFEEHNYLVLTFKNKADWVWLNSIFPLKTVKALDSKEGFEKQGVGRVVDGVVFLEAVTKP